MSETVESSRPETQEAPAQGWPSPWRDRAEIVRFADLTIAECFRQFARYGGKIVEEDGLLLFAGAHPHPNPFRNGAMRLGGQLTADETLDRAQRFFAPLQRSYVVWAREADTDLEELCAAQSLQLLEPDGLPELYLEGPPPKVKPLPDDVVLRRSNDPQVARDYVDVVAEGWGMGGISNELASQIFFHPDSMALDPNVIAFIAYVDDRPASCCMTLLAYGIAVGGNAATVPWARRRGLAEACYAAGLQVAYEEFGIRGSVCQSSPSGQGVWGRMGYRPLTRYMRFMGKPQAATWE